MASTSKRCRDYIPGGRASGMCPADFDPAELRRGTAVEREHTGDDRIAREIAMDHLDEHPRYYDALEQMERKLAAIPNKRGSRVRVYEAEEIAANYRSTFQGAPCEHIDAFGFWWPAKLQHVGDSLAVAYESDKWKQKGDRELYKHLAESRNRALCVPGLIRDYSSPGRAWPVVGPVVALNGVPMPRDFAILGLFDEADLRLHVGGTIEHPEFGPHKDDGVVKVTVRHGMLGASKILWSRVSSRRDQPFLFIYTEQDGVLMLIVGDELDVERDGIVG